MLLAVLKRVAMAVSFACRDVLGFNACCTCVLCAGGTRRAWEVRLDGTFAGTELLLGRVRAAGPRVLAWLIDSIGGRGER